MFFVLGTILPYCALTEANKSLAWRIAVPVVIGLVVTMAMFSPLFLDVRVKDENREAASK